MKTLPETDKDRFLNKYGEVKVKFVEYYKYTFIFTADLGEGKTLSVCVGGNADDIYRQEVGTTAVSVAELFPYSGGVYKDKNSLESFYDY